MGRLIIEWSSADEQASSKTIAIPQDGTLLNEFTIGVFTIGIQAVAGGRPDEFDTF